MNSYSQYNYSTSASASSAYKYQSTLNSRQEDMNVFWVLFGLTLFILSVLLLARGWKLVLFYKNGPAAYDPYSFEPHYLRDSDRVFTYHTNIFSGKFWENQTNTLWKHRITNRFLLSVTYEISHKQKIELISKDLAEKTINLYSGLDADKLVKTWLKQKTAI
jgi:hypothetical protein